ncbi:hypothetical protein L248_2069 [Schleiferilactobacillus shenzhenensis LY-73]|uniref:CAAX prenyl protease 2/Lysostaphin resistance protein A-like domain-containing protein n=2 Tax=Schleiferilactobacillus shenzhenensis TaxID=1231337 RepID=U4TVX3_9LACO|nr:hypothetical protein L248_2069 [Schleiferilactobacillus shenzhenensis LY-73]
MLLYAILMAGHIGINRFEAAQAMSQSQSLLVWLLIDLAEIMVILLMMKYVFKIRLLIGKGHALQLTTVVWLMPMILSNVVSVLPQHFVFPSKYQLFLVIVEMTAAVVFEELLGRGLIIPIVLQYTRRSTVVVTLSAVTFAGTHLINALFQPLQQVLGQILFTLLLGIILAQVYLLTADILSPIVLHLVWNASIVIPGLFGTGYAFSTGINSLMLIVGFACLFALIHQHDRQITASRIRSFTNGAFYGRQEWGERSYRRKRW